jgi:hypothetical protein
MADMSVALERNAYLEKDGKRRPFYLRISEPRPEADAEDLSCLVHAPLLLNSDKAIFGIDASQARSLAVRFIELLIEDQGIVDNAGHPINLGEL